MARTKTRKKKKSKLLRNVGIATGVGAALYGAEKLAERMGVRGGAGFVGRRKGTGRSRKKSAGWYARQILRLKLKRKYDKLRLAM